MLSDDEGIAYAGFDLNRCVEPKQFHDVVGYYNRYDVFALTVNRERQEPVTFRDARSHSNATAQGQITGASGRQHGVQPGDREVN
jgi:nitrilase